MGVLIEAGEWIYRIFFTLIIATVSIAIIASTVNVELNTKPLQEQLLLSNILYNANGFWYKEDGVMYTGVVDKSRFTQEVMDEAFAYKDNYGAARITLNSRSSSQTYYVSEQTFRNFEEQYRSGLGGVTLSKREYPVLVKTSYGEENGKLTVELAVPNVT